MATKTLGSLYVIWPVETNLSLICDGRITDQIVEDFGVNVKIREVRKSSFNQYGDATKSFKDSIIHAYINRFTNEDDGVKEGTYKNGEILFVFKISDEAKIKTGNYIFYSYIWYKIKEINWQIMAGRKYLIEARVEIAIEPTLVPQ